MKRTAKETADAVWKTRATIAGATVFYIRGKMVVVWKPRKS